MLSGFNNLEKLHSNIDNGGNDDKDDDDDGRNLFFPSLGHFSSSIQHFPLSRSKLDDGHSDQRSSEPGRGGRRLLRGGDFYPGS